MGVGDGRGEEWEGVFSSRHSQGGAAGGEKRCQCCFFCFVFFYYLNSEERENMFPVAMASR